MDHDVAQYSVFIFLINRYATEAFLTHNLKRLFHRRVYIQSKHHLPRRHDLSDLCVFELDYIVDHEAFPFGNFAFLGSQANRPQDIFLCHGSR